MSTHENIVQLTGISRKSDELRAQFLLRENKTTPPHVNPTHEHPKPAFRGGAKKNPVRPNQATAPNAPAVTRAGAYRTGDGDMKVVTRPNSDHSAIRSLGFAGEAIYHNRGHV